jgi:uncharacterized protein
MDAKSIIETLGMSPHPEGGWYVETFRDADGGRRGHSTAIYYLLEAGQRSHWHRVVDAAEGWHFYAGSALELSVSADGKSSEAHILGLDLAKGERPQFIVPANHWQSARSIGEWTLVGCTVAPGFEFSSFEMAAPDWQPGAKPRPL